MERVGPGGVGSGAVSPPDFTDHKLPSTIVPAPSSLVGEYVDVAIVALLLGLATYLALVRRRAAGCSSWRSRRSPGSASGRQGCICPIGAIQNVSLALFDSSYAIPLSVIALFVLPLLVTLFFGRTFCGSVCPLGAIQELTLIRPVRVTPWLDHTLGLIPYIYLGRRGRAGHNRSGLHHLRVRPVRRLLPPQWRGEHADLWRLSAAHRSVRGPTVLPLPLPVGGHIPAPGPAVEVARADPARRLHQLPAL